MNIKHLVSSASALLLLTSFAPLTLAAPAAPVSSPYFYNFNQSGKLVEAGSMDISTSPYWWVNSGAYMNISGGRAHTVQGELPANDPFRILYAANNPVDTDNGYHPQNIFRLLTRSKWQNTSQEAFFIVNKDVASQSWNKNSSNGLLLFDRYQDSQSLYYAGIRVDGAAVIKKKLNGTYSTLRYVPGIYPGTYSASNPNLLPKNRWIGLRTEVQNLPNGSVNIKLFMDKGWSGNWTLVAEATDSTNPITAPGYGGIRTDFMDVTFENFYIKNL